MANTSNEVQYEVWSLSWAFAHRLDVTRDLKIMLDLWKIRVLQNHFVLQSPSPLKQAWIYSSPCSFRISPALSEFAPCKSRSFDKGDPLILEEKGWDRPIHEEIPFGSFFLWPKSPAEFRPATVSWWFLSGSRRVSHNFGFNSREHPQTIPTFLLEGEEEDI